TREVRPEYERNSPRMSSNSYVNLKIATCLVRYADDRLIDQRFLRNASSFLYQTSCLHMKLNTNTGNGLADIRLTI
ncbi:hypothetical protein QZN10_15145, partial [Burkholderia contaminans]|uniref:hypothetical protein n=1 Tax=Burkholderia contaminans TaxID=488447 RepID=UPI00264B8154